MSAFNVDSNIARASTIDKSVYTSPEFFISAKEKIFAKTWQYAGHNEQLQKTGDCMPVALLPGYLDEPLIVTNANNSLHCMSNVCTHRGKILAEHACNVNQLRCRYHGRVFDMKGKFKSMPEFKEVENFPSEADNLTRVSFFEWSKFLFASINPIKPAEVFFNDMMQRVAWMPLHEFMHAPQHDKDYLINCNWALYCENYLEGFHVPFVHACLNAVLDFSDYNTELFFPYSNLQLGVSKTSENCFDLPATSPDYGRNIAAYYFWVFPNMMFNFYPWGLSINIIQPLSVDKTKVRFITFIWREELRNTGAGGDLDKVEKEDEEIVESVQKGVQSRFYNKGRYSVTREQGTHHFHRLLAEFLG
ncbi:MAG: aromatic ring-hydroxylating dioxygenase subunit alpha [Bacteroidetes bacterium]|nr:aromatic ring-hydroxylating dioxygenase subunit alpha [Bacteroidota bacterium]